VYLCVCRIRCWSYSVNKNTTGMNHFKTVNAYWETVAVFLLLRCFQNRNALCQNIFNVQLSVICVTSRL